MTALAMAVLASGCTHVITTRERQDSFATHGPDRIGNEPARTYLANRIGVLIGGAHVTAKTDDDGRIIELTLEKPDPDRLGFGMVTAIDRRGYLLTTAHGVGNEDVYLVFGTDRNSSRLERARVVWKTHRHQQRRRHTAHLASHLDRCSSRAA